MTSTMAMASGSGDYSAGAMIPITRSFVQTAGGSAVTTQYALVGQVLDNGQTNWVGYNQGSAEYLMTSSAADAQQTTLADGNTYYVSEGKAPAGYLAGVTMTTATATSGAGSMSTDMVAATTSASDSLSSPPSSSSDESPSGSSSGSASAATTSSSSGTRLATGALFTLALGLMAALSIKTVA